ncbi:MAG: hypothetical protein ACYDGY_04115 [Acidimicrobiales bacterium]
MVGLQAHPPGSENFPLDAARLCLAVQCHGGFKGADTPEQMVSVRRHGSEPQQQQQQQQPGGESNEA